MTFRTCQPVKNDYFSALHRTFCHAVICPKLLRTEQLRTNCPQHGHSHMSCPFCCCRSQMRDWVSWLRRRWLCIGGLLCGWGQTSSYCRCIMAFYLSSFLSPKKGPRNRTNPFVRASLALYKWLFRVNIQRIIVVWNLHSGSGQELQQIVSLLYFVMWLILLRFEKY